ncbi:hypothetical protein ACTHR6_24845 [Ralstonia holmesii]|uniref:hypothetical protein n=1 Tax=Ralstonia TaxID=48736 RepID=UPI00046A98AE|nr:hypothetical protein [Ralstonia pickettii]
MSSRKLTIAAVVIALLAGVYGAGLMVGRISGTRAASKALDRLQLIWPSFMTMPMNDRALIVVLAMSCRLEDRQAKASEVIACLREAASDPHTLLPNGERRADVPARLEQLLPPTI